MVNAVIDPVTNQFCADGMKPGRVLIQIARNPDERLERYTGDPENPFRPATAQEISDAVAANADATATVALDGQRLVKALALVVGDLTGRTPAQMAAAVKAKYKTLA